MGAPEDETLSAFVDTSSSRIVINTYDDGLDAMYVPVDVSDEAVLLGFVQRLHIDKILTRSEFPGVRGLEDAHRARALGADVAKLAELRHALRTELERYADRLLADRAVRQRVAALPFARGDVVLGIGDSITDDELSWFQLLASAHRRVAGTACVRFINAAIAGETSAEIMRRVPAMARTRPDWCLVMAGTNDALRCGAQAEMLISHPETARNLEALDTQLRAVAARGVLWLTPPPVHDVLIARSPFHRERSIVLRDADVAAKCLHVPGPSVDVRAHFGDRRAEWLSPDGVHPNASGHAEIAAEAAAAIASWTKT